MILKVTRKATLKPKRGLLRLARCYQSLLDTGKFDAELLWDGILASAEYVLHRS